MYSIAWDTGVYADGFQVNDNGKDLIIVVSENETAKDISTATVMTYRLELPDGTAVDKTAGFNTDGKDGKLKYTTDADDLSQNGDWVLQVLLTISAKVQYSEKLDFTVTRNLTAPSP